MFSGKKTIISGKKAIVSQTLSERVCVVNPVKAIVHPLPIFTFKNLEYGLRNLVFETPPYVFRHRIGREVYKTTNVC